jgi:hypothetical protein
MMRTAHRTRGLPARARHSHRVLRPVAGQCFEIEIRQDAGRWIVAIPEINAATEANGRTDVERAARECIAARTGIPLGYISVWVRD